MSTAIPTTADELEEMLNDDKALTALQSEGTLGNFTKAYVAAFDKRNKDFKDDLKNEVQKSLVEFMNENGWEGGKPPVDFTPGDKGSKPWGRQRIDVINNGQAIKVDRPYSNTAVGTKLNTLFDDSAELFRAASKDPSRYADRATLQAKRSKLEEIQNSFGSLVPADGGFLIPEVMRDELLMIALESAIVRPRATVVPMSSLRLPFPAVDETTHSGSIRGGIIAYWTEEGASLAESQAAFSRVVLEAKKLAAYAAAPNELVADAPAFRMFIDRALPDAIVWFEDIAFFNGTGVGEPLGWNTALNGALITYDVAVSSAIAWSDVVGMYARMLPGSLNSAVWLASPDVFPQLAAMTFGTGQFPALIPVGGGGGAFNFSLLGRPVIITEKAKALGTDGALAFVDLSYYLVGDRQEMTVAESTDYLFGSDKTAFRVIERVDGRPWIQSAITPQNGSTNTLSPFVVASGAHT